MTHPTLLRHLQRGFSLMEITIGLVLLGMLSLVGTAMFTNSFFTTQTISQEQMVQSAARYAMERMVREIREIQFTANPVTVAISSPIPTSAPFTTSSISFTRSGLSSTSNVTFALSYNANPSLSTVNMSYVLNDAAPANLLAKNIKSLTFTYLTDANGTLASSSDTVRFVRIDMRVALSAQAPELPLITLVHLRNT